MTPLIVFRADASIEIGSGHVIRCIILANFLQKHGACVHFISKEFPGNLFERIAQSGIELCKIPTHGSTDCKKSWETDATDTIKYIKNLPKIPDWVIVDHYGLDGKWETKIRAFTNRLCVIDDLFDRPHAADILFNQSVLSLTQTEKRSSLQNCMYLTGPQYALLHEEYRQARLRLAREFTSIKRVLIFFGGADHSNFTEMLCKKLITQEHADLQFDVILGITNPHQKEILSFAEKHTNFHVHIGLPNLAQKIASADLAIGAGGSTTWEMLCLGLPFIAISTAENQYRTCEELAANGYILYLGTKESFEFGDLAAAIKTCRNPFFRKFISKHAITLVDGNGCKKLGDRLLLQNP